MIEKRFVAGWIAVPVVLFCTFVSAGAQDFTIFSTFDADTPGSPPAIGGSDQPTGILNTGVGVLVQSSANGIATQPLEVADSDCSASSFYFGGVYYDLPAPITGGVLRIEATVAANQLTTGVFFDTGTDPYGPSVARLYFDNLGSIHDQHGVVVASYAANTPFRLRADIDMDTKTWACTIDDELNGFDDDSVTPGLAFVNDPAGISQVGRVYLDLFGSFNIWTCVPPRTVAFDDLLIVAPVPIFADGFESGNTDAWSTVIP
jgi:hypothetical protein